MNARIEFVGLCGAGKSTFISASRDMTALSSRLSFSYPVAPSTYMRIVCMVRIIGLLLVKAPFKCLIFMSRKNNWWLLKKLAFRSAGIRKRHNKRLILVDSGVLQPFLSFEIEEKTSGSEIPLYLLLSCIPLPDIILDFCIPPEKAKERYHERESREGGRNIRKDSESHFISAENIKNKIVSFCSENKITVIKIDATREFNRQYLLEKSNEIVDVLDSRDMAT